MADSFTPNYSIIQPQVGGDSGTWGGLLNSGAFGVIDSILGANTTVSITSADVTITTTQFQNSLFIVNGTLTGNHAMIVPFQTNSTTVACGGKFVVVNNGTGNFNLSVKSAAGGNSATVPQGFSAELYSDGTNIAYASTGLPASAPSTNGSPNGQLAGTAGSVNTNASLAADYQAGNLYLCTQSGTASSAVWANVGGAPGFDTARNLSFTTSISANALTITALAANVGTTPSPGNAITIPFRDNAVANGDPVILNVTSALTLTVPSGASLGSSNNTPFRFWLVAFNNGGTVQLGVINCSAGTRIFPLNETAVASATSISGSSTSAGTFYASSTITSKSFRIVGFLSYESGLVTAGTYNNGPTYVQLFGSGVKKPGDTVAGISGSGQSGAITPTSTVNLIRVFMSQTWEVLQNNSLQNGSLSVLFTRNSSQIASAGAGAVATDAGTSAFIATFSIMLYDNPYGGGTYSSSGSASIWTGSVAFTAGNFLLEEIMG